MGIAAVTISGMWSTHLIIEALKTPVKISEFMGVPVGIFQVVLIVGLIIHYYNRQIYSFLVQTLKKISIRAFAFFVVVFFGLTSSIISVIVSAVILAEIALVMPLERKQKIEFVVIACFALGFGAALTPIGEPLSTIAIKKLNEEFFYLLKLVGIYIIPSVIVLGIYASMRVGSSSIKEIEIPTYTETLRSVFVRAIRVYAFIAALVLLGEGFTPIIDWYIIKIPPEILYWVNMISAVLDNATLAAAEIGPQLTELQIKSVLMGLIISGGMLIPGNIPNIVAAGRLRITMSEWARVGVPLGLILMGVFFVIIFLM